MEYIIFWCFCAVVAAIIAGAKGRSGAGWFCLGLVFGPFAWGVALLPSQVAQPSVASGIYKKCPSCAELIRSEAVKCRYCQSDVAAATVSLPEDGLFHPLAILSPQETAQAEGYLHGLREAGYTHLKRPAGWEIITPSSRVCGTVTTLEELRDLAHALAGERRCAPSARPQA